MELGLCLIWCCTLRWAKKRQQRRGQQMTDEWITKVFWVLSMVSVGILLLYIPLIIYQKGKLQSMVPSQASCQEICSYPFLQENPPGTCCSGETCYTKEQCQSRWDTYYLVEIIIQSCLITAFGAFVLKVVINRRNQNRPEGPARNADNKPNDIFVPLNQSNALNSESVCSICLNDLEEGETTLECQHTFHRTCIQTYISNHGTCPLCSRT